MKWRMFGAQWKLHVEDYYGKSIHYEGVRFEGSPQLVFWNGFIEPFLENGIIFTLRETYNDCFARNLPPQDYLAEARDLLRLWVEKTYRYMAQTDQALRAEGYPDSIQPVNVASKISSMHQYIDENIVAFTYKVEKPIESRATRDIIEIKPNIYGIGLNLNELWRRFRAWIKTI